MSLYILKAGLQTTLQDGGRWGYQKEGILVSGAMDLLALRIANLLVGNAANTGAIEINMTGPMIRFEQDHLIALSGADLSASLDGRPLQNWRYVRVKKGNVLAFGRAKKGRIAYLAVAGGFNIAPLMGSTATYLRAGIGGFEGRALMADDLIPCNGIPEQRAHLMYEQSTVPMDADMREASWTPAPDMRPSYEDNPRLRIIKGPEWAQFCTQSQHLFFRESFTVSPRSDRMGSQLEGPALALDRPNEMLSSSVAFGTIQVPAGGKPIVLLADHQTTGGYPRIGQVATVDFSKLVQLQPGQSMHFQEITVQEAQQLYIAQELRMAALKTAIDLKLKVHR